MEGFFFLDWDNARGLSCLNDIRKMRYLRETNHLAVTCKSVVKSTAWMNIHLCLWYYSTYKHIFAEIKKFSWLCYGGCLQRKNQLKIRTFLITEPQMPKQIFAQRAWVIQINVCRIWACLDRVFSFQCWKFPHTPVFTSLFPQLIYCIILLLSFCA